MNRSTTVVASLLLVLLACREDAPPNRSATTRVEVPSVERSSSLVLVVGAVEGDEAQEFGRIRGVVFEDSHLLVLDAMAKEIRVFDADGRFLRRIGRAGEGPGEFVIPMSLNRSGDTIWVWDHRLWRIAAFDSLGGLLASHPVAVLEQSGWPVQYQRLPTGRWLYLSEYVAPDINVPPGDVQVIRSVATFKIWDPVTAEWSDVAVVDGGEAAVTTSERGRRGLVEAPFPARPLWSVSPRGGFWYGDSRSYRLTKFTEQGELSQELVVPVEGADVTSADREEYISPPDYPPERRDQIAKQRRKVAIPARKPVLASLHVSEEGDLWVKLASTDPFATWHVYGDGGEPLFRTSLPASFRPTQIRGDQLVGHEKNELGVDFAIVRVLEN